jgi:hypothetical protein
MLQDDLKQSETLELARGLFAGIRETNIRLRELKNFLKEDLCKEDRKEEILKRIERLVDTKFCLIYSIYDIRNKLIRELSDSLTGDRFRELERVFDLTTLYKDLKDL